MPENEYNAIIKCGKKKNKEYAETIMKFIERYQCLNADDIALLTDRQACKDNFRSRLSMLLQVKNDPDIIDKAAIVSGHQRYYKIPYLINGQYYIFTNHLYGPGKSHQDNRTPFLEWILKKCKPDG